MTLNILFLTCTNQKEAREITERLLKEKLVFCVKKLNISSSFLWKGQIEKSEEVLLILDSAEENFSKVEKEVRKYHSYDTFVLLSVPVSKTTENVLHWIKKELN